MHRPRWDVPGSLFFLIPGLPLDPLSFVGRGFDGADGLLFVYFAQAFGELDVHRQRIKLGYFPLMPTKPLATKRAQRAALLSIFYEWEVDPSVSLSALMPKTRSALR